jgi:hypothetical protein
MRRFKFSWPGRYRSKSPVARYEIYLEKEEERLRQTVQRLQNELTRLRQVSPEGASSFPLSSEEFRPAHRMRRKMERNAFLFWMSLAIFSLLILWAKRAQVLEWLRLYLKFS